jgi:sporulation protein YlmC with PRC-barrel domain
LLPTLFASKVDYNNQINNTVFNLEGENLGKVTDIVLSDNYKVEKILIKDQEYAPSSVISFNQNNLIINSSGVKYTKENYKPKQSMSKPKLDLVKILPKAPEKELNDIPKIDFDDIDLKPKQNSQSKTCFECFSIKINNQTILIFIINH